MALRTEWSARRGKPRSAGWQAAPSEQGETLIEILFAVVIISITVVALLGALMTSITGSAEHRSIAAIDSILKSYAETAKYQIELQPVTSTSAPLFVDCPNAGPSSAVLTAYQNGVKWAAPPGYGSGSGYAVTITQVQPWNKVTNNWDATCPSGGPNNDVNGLQLLTFQAIAPNNISDKMQMVVRNPDYPTTTPNPYAGF
jgi:type II secretory pathway pseudopilin PulG